MKKQPHFDNLIIPLKGADRVRRRPTVIFGDDGLDGCESAFYGLFENAVDEAKDGFADAVSVTVTDDGTVEIGDNGRGVPMGWNEDEQDWNWRLIFCELYAGGKFGDDPLGGLDACAAQYASELTEVYSYDGKRESYMHFTKGDPDSDLRVTPLESPRRGTVIRWKPDPEVFTETRIPKDYFKTVTQNAAMLTPGLRIILNYCGDISEYCYKDGISERLREIAGNSSAILHWSFGGTGKDREDGPEYTYSCDIALCASDRGHEEYFHNGKSLPLGGVIRDAIRSTVTRFAGRYMPDCDIDSDEIFGKIMLICKTGSDRTYYLNGTMTAITNPFMKHHMSEELAKLFELMLYKDPENAEAFFAKLLQN